MTGDRSWPPNDATRAASSSLEYWLGEGASCAAGRSHFGGQQHGRAGDYCAVAAAFIAQLSCRITCGFAVDDGSGENGWPDCDCEEEVPAAAPGLHAGVDQ